MIYEQRQRDHFSRCRCLFSSRGTMAKVSSTTNPYNLRTWLAMQSEPVRLVWRGSAAGRRALTGIVLAIMRRYRASRNISASISIRIGPDSIGEATITLKEEQNDLG